MKKEVSIKLDTTEMITLERCLANRNAGEAFRLLKALAEQAGTPRPRREGPTSR